MNTKILIALASTLFLAACGDWVLETPRAVVVGEPGREPAGSQGMARTAPARNSPGRDLGLRVPAVNDLYDEKGRPRKETPNLNRGSRKANSDEPTVSLDPLSDTEGP